jgi:hypothetical protein
MTPKATKARLILLRTRAEALGEILREIENEVAELVGDRTIGAYDAMDFLHNDSALSADDLWKRTAKLCQKPRTTRQVRCQ